MSHFVHRWRTFLFYMFTSPLSNKRPDFVAGGRYDHDTHVGFLAIGWFIAVIGIVISGFYVPYLVERVIIPWLPVLRSYQEYAVVVLVFIGAFLFQALILLTLTTCLSMMQLLPSSISNNTGMAIFAVLFIYLVLPIGLLTWSIYWYVTHFAPNHDLVGAGIVGALFLKLVFIFVPGFVKTVVVGTLFTSVMRILRGKRGPEKPVS